MARYDKLQNLITWLVAFVYNPWGVETYVLQVELELLFVRLEFVSQLIPFMVECKQALKKGQELERNNIQGWFTELIELDY